MIRVKPAYGRRYFKDSEVVKDWEANKDFLMHEGSYINKSDYKKHVGGWDTILFQDAFISVKLEDGIL